MSRIGNKPIPIPAGAKIEIAGQDIHVTGPKGKLSWQLPKPIAVVVENNQLVVRRPDDVAHNRALHGMARALIANMVKGVTSGYEIGLEIYGTGYNVKVEARRLMLNCGFSGRGFGKPAQFDVPIPVGLEIKVAVPSARGNTEPARFFVVGPDKQAVGQFAAEVRKLRKPEPYLGKGIRYQGEHIRRKAGKVFAGGGAGG